MAEASTRSRRQAVLITGANRGIGRHLAIGMADAGRDVALLGRRAEELAYTGYAMSKGAVARFTTQLDAQYREHGIRAFDLAPGHIATAMTHAMPMHEGRTAWTDPKDVIALAVAIADGSLDDLAGRFFRADTDTPESLRESAADIIDRAARTLRMIT